MPTKHFSLNSVTGKLDYFQYIFIEFMLFSKHFSDIIEIFVFLTTKDFSIRCGRQTYLQAYSRQSGFNVLTAVHRKSSGECAGSVEEINSNTEIKEACCLRLPLSG